MVGMVTGVVAGLAAVTPASGYIGPLGGVALGVCSSLICFGAVELVKHRWKIDDSLDVFAVHGVGGILGSLLVAGLASKALGGVGYAAGMDMGAQFQVQAMGVGVTILWSAGASVVILFVVKRVIGLRAHDAAIEDGLDLTHHGERAYTQ